MNHKTRQSIGSSLRESRNRNGLTQEELAAKMNISRSTIAKVEAGKWSIGIDLLSRFCDALGLEVVVVNKAFADWLKNKTLIVK